VNAKNNDVLFSKERLRRRRLGVGFQSIHVVTYPNSSQKISREHSNALSQIAIMPPVEENEVLKRKSIVIVPDPDAFASLTPRDEAPNKKIRILEGEL
jgi:hypothetical protein